MMGRVKQHHHLHHHQQEIKYTQRRRVFSLLFLVLLFLNQPLDQYSCEGRNDSLRESKVHECLECVSPSSSSSLSPSFTYSFRTSSCRSTDTVMKDDAICSSSTCCDNDKCCVTDGCESPNDTYTPIGSEPRLCDICCDVFHQTSIINPTKTGCFINSWNPPIESEEDGINFGEDQFSIESFFGGLGGGGIRGSTTPTTTIDETPWYNSRTVDWNLNSCANCPPCAKCSSRTQGEIEQLRRRNAGVARCTRKDCEDRRFTNYFQDPCVSGPNGCDCLCMSANQLLDQCPHLGSAFYGEIDDGGWQLIDPAPTITTAPSSCLTYYQDKIQDLLLRKENENMGVCSEKECLNRKGIQYFQDPCDTAAHPSASFLEGCACFCYTANIIVDGCPDASSILYNDSLVYGDGNGDGDGYGVINASPSSSSKCPSDVLDRIDVLLIGETVSCSEVECEDRKGVQYFQDPCNASPQGCDCFCQVANAIVNECPDDAPSLIYGDPSVQPSSSKCSLDVLDRIDTLLGGKAASCSEVECEARKGVQYFQDPCNVSREGCDCFCVAANAIVDQCPGDAPSLIYGESSSSKCSSDLLDRIDILLGGKTASCSEVECEDRKGLKHFQDPCNASPQGCDCFCQEANAIINECPDDAATLIYGDQPVVYPQPSLSSKCSSDVLDRIDSLLGGKTASCSEVECDDRKGVQYFQDPCNASPQGCDCFCQEANAIVYKCPDDAASLIYGDRPVVNPQPSLPSKCSIEVLDRIDTLLGGETASCSETECDDRKGVQYFQDPCNASPEGCDCFCQEANAIISECPDDASSLIYGDPPVVNPQPSLSSNCSSDVLDRIDVLLGGKTASCNEMECKDRKGVQYFQDPCNASPQGCDCFCQVANAIIDQCPDDALSLIYGESPLNCLLDDNIMEEIEELLGMKVTLGGTSCQKEECDELKDVIYKRDPCDDMSSSSSRSSNSTTGNNNCACFCQMANDIIDRCNDADSLLYKEEEKADENEKNPLVEVGEEEEEDVLTTTAIISNNEEKNPVTNTTVNAMSTSFTSPPVTVTNASAIVDNVTTTLADGISNYSSSSPSSLAEPAAREEGGGTGEDEVMVNDVIPTESENANDNNDATKLSSRSSGSSVVPSMFVKFALFMTCGAVLLFC